MVISCNIEATVLSCGTVTDIQLAILLLQTIPKDHSVLHHKACLHHNKSLVGNTEKVCTMMELCIWLWATVAPIWESYSIHIHLKGLHVFWRAFVN